MSADKPDRHDEADKAEHDEPTAVIGTPEADAMVVPHGDGKPDVAMDDPDPTDKAEHDEATAVIGTPEADAMVVPHGDGKPAGNDHQPGGQGADASAGDDEEHGILAYSTLPPPRKHRVLVYSSDASVRDRVRNAVGRQPAADLGGIEWSEVDTGKKVVAALDAGGLDLVILDGEAKPTGGLGLSKQLKDEIKDCPPFLVLIARQDDRWLARWSNADAIVAFPVDAPALTSVVAEQLRAREAGLPVKRAFA